jgi:COMPASS component SPP1
VQARIAKWAEKGGNKERLWESVKNAQKREGVTVRVEPEPSKEQNVKMEVDQDDRKPRTRELVVPEKTIVQREVDRLHSLLEELQQKRDEVNRTMDIVQWRERLVELADRRSERVDECGWDQRLCFGDTEWAEFGAGVLESYDNDTTGVSGEDNQIRQSPSVDEEWWCRGKKKCERHSGSVLFPIRSASYLLIQWVQDGRSCAQQRWRSRRTSKGWP